MNKDLAELNRLLVLLEIEWNKSGGHRNYKGVEWEK